jgi:hypothetical protein
MNFSNGQTVYHKEFGKGVVDSTGSSFVSVIFDDGRRVVFTGPSMDDLSDKPIETEKKEDIIESRIAEKKAKRRK